MLYLIDSDCLMSASQYYYPMDVALSFWLKLKDLLLRDNIKSIDKVKKRNISHG